MCGFSAGRRHPNCTGMWLSPGRVHLWENIGTKAGESASEHLSLWSQGRKVALFWSDKLGEPVAADWADMPSRGKKKYWGNTVEKRERAKISLCDINSMGLLFNWWCRYKYSCAFNVATKRVLSVFGWWHYMNAGLMSPEGPWCWIMIF